MDIRFSMFLASILGLIPTYGLLTLGTWWYERKMDEKDLNITYIIGIFIGVVVVVAHIFFAISYGFGSLAIPAAFLLALLEVLIYRAYLNRSKLRGRTDQPFMAFALALGISGSYILFVTGNFFASARVLAGNTLGLILFAISVPVARSAVAIQFSSDRASGRKLLPALVGPVLILTAYNLMIMFYLIGGFLWPFSVAGAIVGMAAFLFAFRRLSLVPDMDKDASDDAGA